RSRDREGDAAVDDRGADDGGRDRRGRFKDRGSGEGGVGERQGVSRDVVHDGAGSLRVRFPFDRRLVDLVKSLPRRRFEINDKVWSVPEDDVVLLVELLQPEGFTFDQEVKTRYVDRGGARVLQISLGP